MKWNPYWKVSLPADRLHQKVRGDEQQSDHWAQVRPSAIEKDMNVVLTEISDRDRPIELDPVQVKAFNEAVRGVGLQYGGETL
jgi:hypothetical protein